MMSRYINPFTNFGFEKLFGTEANKDLLIDFLNTILPEKSSIKSLTYLPTERLGDRRFERKDILDVYCENELGEKFIVEMQKAEQDYFKDRSIFYSTFPIREQAIRGKEWDFELKAVYTIGLLDFVFDKSPLDDDIMHHEVVLFDKKTSRVFYDKLTYIYLELPKFRKTENELETNFDKWMFLLCHMDVLDRCPAKLQSKIFEKAFATAEIARYDEAEQRSYEESLKVYRDLINVVRTAERKGIRQGMEQGMKKGIEQGIKQGIEQGIQQGMERGKYEEKLQIAAHSLSMGFDMETVAKLTGLPFDEIEKLVSSQGKD